MLRLLIKQCAAQQDTAPCVQGASLFECARPDDVENIENILKLVGGHFLPDKINLFPDGEGWGVNKATETTHFPAEKGYIVSNQSTKLTAYDIYHKEVYIS